MAASASLPRTSEDPAAAEAEAYEDLLPVLGERLGTAGLLAELRAGFRVLADPARGAITPESLRRGAAAGLGVPGMSAAEAEAMVREGDGDGDGALSEAEFCVLMVRLSPGIMGDAEAWLADAIADEMWGVEMGEMGGGGGVDDDDDDDGMEEVEVDDGADAAAGDGGGGDEAGGAGSQDRAGGGAGGTARPAAADPAAQGHDPSSV